MGECNVLAAMKLSHGEDLRMTVSCLHEGIKASEDALTCDLEAFNWFDLSILTDLLSCQPYQSLPVAEINYWSLLPNKFKNLVGLENAAGLASPPYTPKGFLSASAIPQSPCINSQLLEFGQLRLNEDVPIIEDNHLQTETWMQTEQDGEPRKHKEQMAQLDNSDGGNEDSRRQVCEEDSDGRNGKSRGKNREDKNAMGVKQVQENRMEKDLEEKGQEEKQEHEQQEEEEEDWQKQEQDKIEKDVAASDPEESDPEELESEEGQGEQLDAEESHVVEEDAVEKDAVEEDSAEEDREEEDMEQEENKEDLEQVEVPPKLDICRSTHLWMQSANPP